MYLAWHHFQRKRERKKRKVVEIVETTPFSCFRGCEKNMSPRHCSILTVQWRISCIFHGLDATNRRRKKGMVPDGFKQHKTIWAVDTVGLYMDGWMDRWMDGWSIHPYMHTCMHACMYVCIYTYIHIYIYTYIQTYIYTYIG